MKRAFLISIIACFLGFCSIQASDLNFYKALADKSVVIVEATVEGKVKHSTGFCWGNSMQVVTALHGVAGSNSVKIYQNGKKGMSSPATISKVYKDADMALLTLQRDMGLEPLSHSTEKVVPNDASGTYKIIRFPGGTYYAGRKNFEFSYYSVEMKIANMLEHNQKLYNQVASTGYPGLKLPIFTVSTTIIPGHSGAPILNKSGQVVAMANGGLRQGTAGLNWAVPASNLGFLQSSNEGAPSASATNLDILHSSATPEKNIVKTGSNASGTNADFQDEGEYVEGYLDGGEDQGIFLANLTFEELRETLPDEFFQTEEEFLEDEGVDEILKDGGVSRDNVLPKQLSVYMDLNSGISFFVPSEIKLEMKEDFYGIEDYDPYNGGVYFGEGDGFDVNIVTRIVNPEEDLGALVERYLGAAFEDVKNVERQDKSEQGEYYINATFQVASEEGGELDQIGYLALIAEGDMLFVMEFFVVDPENASGDDRISFVTFLYSRIVTYYSMMEGVFGDQ